ncbi:bifunctional DNA primase/polymerase [Catenuloplanes indicus]|uniref:DNA primase/polymerase bifunctional N-terminal domain-containing protein n=1 Tax=Catenuloplanes indicus TaxID=137267 RepID=A0AAE3W3D7_9ACTN|nr:bifunctional DNA primase/polymerase [Catenuloplanes indicus]MDQ0367964.1 hypothetical protein [Catenuloplanes indicus]
MLLAAYALAAEGLPVFFLGRTKRPVANCPGCPKGDPNHDPEACECLTCHGFYAASTDPDRITAMRAAVPRGLLAIRTGGPVAVVDIDPRNGGRIVPELMPPTRAVRTGSDGWHLYYAHPGGALGAKLHGYPGIDIKADGGYVVAPPSMHPLTGRPYRWIGDRPTVAMPPALVDACRAPVPAESAPPRATVIPLSGGRGISSPEALLEANLNAVRNAPRGQRRTRLYGAARGIARMVKAGAITHARAVDELTRVGREMGQPERDIRAAIIGGFRAESVATEGIAA